MADHRDGTHGTDDPSGTGSDGPGSGGSPDGRDLALEAALAARPAVLDVAVLRRTGTDGRGYRVAYVVPAPGADPGTLRRVVDAAGLRAPTGDPVLLSVISRVPRDGHGRPDPGALAALPVIPGDATPEAVPAPGPARLHLDALLDLPARWQPDATATADTDGPDPGDGDDDGPPAWCTGPDPEPHRHPDDPDTLVTALLAAADREPDLGVHVIGEAGERAIGYPELLAAARRVLTALRAQGLGPGDPVLLHLPDLGDHLVGLWACLLGGMRPVAVAQAPGYDRRNAVLDKLEHAWRTLGQAPVLSGGGTVAALRGYGERAGWAGLRVLDLAGCRDAEPAADLHSPRPDEVAFLQLSSGSTGRSKVIQVTHGGVIRYAQAARRALTVRPGDVFANWLPLDHVVGTLSFHLAPVVLRCAQVHAGTGLVLADPLRWLDVLQRHRAAHSWSPNFGFTLIADAVRANPDRRWDLSSVRTLVNAGEQCTEPVMARFVAAVEPFGITAPAVVLGWGMAETCTMICHQPLTAAAVQHVRRSGSGRLTLLDGPEPGSSTLLSMGPPDPGTEFRVTGPGGAVLPELTIGRLQVRSARVTPGYLNNPAADAEAFVGDGWFDTGDLAFATGGRITITGRAKEIIIVNGVHHFCHEIEDVVGAVDGVTPSFVAAVAVPSPAGTEQPAVLFVPRSGPVTGRVLAAVREALARRLQLTAVVLVAVPREDFDKTTSGKIQRAAMRARLLAGELDDAVRAAELAEAGPRTVPDCLYRPLWTPRRFPVVAGPDAGRTLVVAGDSGPARSLAGRLPGAVPVRPDGV
ncbi:MAG TPA: AMP-binding protein, partial [Pseudonocardiaceae bacterium]